MASLSYVITGMSFHAALGSGFVVGSMGKCLKSTSCMYGKMDYPKELRELV